MLYLFIYESIEEVFNAYPHSLYLSSPFSFFVPVNTFLLLHTANQPCYAYPDLDLSATSAVSASSPSFHSTNSHNPLADDLHLAAPLISYPTSPGASSLRASGSPGQQCPPRHQSSTPLPTFHGTRESSPDKRAESNSYYTTAWGSPYAVGSPRRLSWTLSEYADFGPESRASTPDSTRSHSSRAAAANNDFLRPSAPKTSHSRQLLHSRGPSRSPRNESSDGRRGRSIKDFTKDWINQFLSGQPRTERSNWLSDDSGSDTPSFLTAENYFNDDPSDGWLGLKGSNREEDPLKTPKLSDFVGRSKTAGAGEKRVGRQRIKDHHHERSDTLRQEDFWGFAFDKDPLPTSMSEIKDRQSAGEKPLPPVPPSNAVDEEAPIGTSSPKATRRPALENGSAPLLPRPKKKIVWRGKACIIALPLKDKRGSEESGYHLLTAEEVEQRLKNWEDEGYDIHGFSIYTPEDPSVAGALGGLSRPPFPDPVESLEEWRAGKYAISFPDKAEWDAYVNFLQEEKLRALGVFLGDGDAPPSVSPVSAAAMSQVAPPPFPGLIASPPIPTASAGSNPLATTHPFSPAFNQSASASTGGIGSLASPVSQLSIQTPFMGVDQNILGGYPIPFQPTPPAQGPLTPQVFNARQPGAISTVPGSLPNLTSIIPSISPLNGGSFHSVPPKDSFDGRFSNDLQGEIADIHPSHPNQGRPEVHTPPGNFRVSNVEITHPTPRTHGHNLSETLQKGLDRIEQPDYHLEQSIERQLDEDERESSHNHFNHTGLLSSRWAIPGNDHRHPVQINPRQNGQHFPSQPTQNLYRENYPEYFGQEGSDFDTNPSLSGTPQMQQPALPWDGAKPSTGSFAAGHQSKHSGSAFGVGAKEFDPISFASHDFSFQGNPFQPAEPENSSSAFAFNSGPTFNPVTTTFKPAFNDQTNNNNNNNDAHPSGFKFSSVTFNVDAPVFNPGGSANSTATGEAAPTTGKSKIFGHIDLSQVSKPAKKSKAIPIVRPDDNERERDKKGRENEKGRSSHSDRHKRARRSNENPDAEAKFSNSVHALTETNNVSLAQTSNSASHAPAEGKENKAPGSDNKSVVDVKSTTAVDEKPVERNDTPVSEATTWISEGHKVESEPAVVNGVATDASGRDGEQKETSELIATKEDERSTGPGDVIRHTREPSDDAAKSSILLANAKPFEFKPPVQDCVPSVTESPSVGPEATIQEQKDADVPRFTPSNTPALAKDEELHSEQPQPEIVVENPKAQANAPRSEPGSDNSATEESLDEEELNAIMDQLNGDSDIGIERQDIPRFADEAVESIEKHSVDQYLVPANRSAAPSPSPRRNQPPNMMNIPPKLGTYFDSWAPAILSPQRGLVSGIQSSVQQLINQNDHISDWGDFVSSSEDEKLAIKSKFFGRRVNDLDGGALEERLIGLEHTLGVIQQSMASMISGAANKKGYRSVSGEVDNSDADDEDEDDEEESVSYRARSSFSRRDRKLDQLKRVVSEALATNAPQPENQAVSELVQLRESFAELKDLTTRKLSQDPTANLKDMIQEVVSRQLDLRKSDAEEIGAESLMLQIDGLKSMLRLADERAEEEYKMRRDAQESVAELKRLLKLAEGEATRHSEAAEAAEARLLQFKEEKIPYFEKLQFRSDSLTQERETLQLTLAELSAKNIALEGTLDEYRVSSDHWRRENEAMKRENKELRTTINHLKVRIDDSMKARQNLRGKFDRLQEDMATAVRDIARDQAAWRKREEDHIARYDGLRATYDREVKLREKLEYDITELEQQEREAAKLKFIFGQSQQENARLEELVANLRLENHDLEVKAARFEREFNEARESSRVEIQRTRTSLESDLEAANSQVNIVRAELEAQIIRVQSQLDNVRLDADTSRERYELLLEEAGEAKVNALAEVAESKELALEEQRKLHERIVNDLRERHARALHNATEDRQRSEAHLMERLALSEDKVQHLQDRVHHLEEKLEIANAAARAAAQAAQEAKAGAAAIPSSPPAPESTSPSISFRKGSLVPERISPQALRESILVLQDQLQHRESRIEELEQELSTVDKDAPNKLKEKDTEIAWLRELLGVRIDDLQDIINTVSQPSFDHNAVRDAAIRLKANLQMQQQEKERTVFGGPSFPSLPSISSLTASPRSLPLAAAAAWGNWRKTRERTNSNQQPEQTPSKPSSAASAFLSGLLTPPGSNFRHQNSSSTSSHENHSSGPAPATTTMGSQPESRPLKAYARPLSSSSRQQENNIDNNNNDSSIPEPPRTPPLLRKSSYDHDAEPTDYENGIFGDDSLVEEYGENAGVDVDDGLDSVSPKGMVIAGDHNEPFGPRIS